LHDGKEIVRLVDIRIIEKNYSSVWASLFPSSSIPKKKGKTRDVNDFRNSIPNIGHYDIIRSMEVFSFAYSHG
jgi:hypothetical protein